MKYLLPPNPAEKCLFFPEAFLLEIWQLTPGQMFVITFVLFHTMGFQSQEATSYLFLIDALYGVIGHMIYSNKRLSTRNLWFKLHLKIKVCSLTLLIISQNHFNGTFFIKTLTTFPSVQMFPLKVVNWVDRSAEKGSGTNLRLLSMDLQRTEVHFLG